MLVEDETARCDDKTQLVTQNHLFARADLTITCAMG